MEQISQWIPTIVTAFGIVALAAVADSNIKRHDASILVLVDKVQTLETEVAVLKEQQKKKT